MFWRARMLQSLFLSHTRILSTLSHVLARVSTCADIVDIVDIVDIANRYYRYLNLISINQGEHLWTVDIMDNGPIIWKWCVWVTTLTTTLLTLIAGDSRQDINCTHILLLLLAPVPDTGTMHHWWRGDSWQHSPGTDGATQGVFRYIKIKGTFRLELYRSNTDRFFQFFWFWFFLVQTSSYYPSKYGATIHWAHFAFLPDLRKRWCNTDRFW